MLGLAGSFVVEDEAGGGGDDNDESGNDLIDDKDLDNNAADSKKETDDKISKMQEKLDSQTEYIQGQKNQEATSAAVAEIKAKHSDFDEAKVYEHLKELAKTDPEKAELLNTPIGWENTWNDIKPKEVENDDPYLARNVGEEDRSEDLLKSLHTDGAISVTDQAEILGNLL